MASSAPGSLAKQVDKHRNTGRRATLPSSASLPKASPQLAARKHPGTWPLRSYKPPTAPLPCVSQVGTGEHLRQITVQCGAALRQAGTFQVADAGLRAAV